MSNVIPFPIKGQIHMIGEFKFECCDHCYDPDSGSLHPSVPLNSHTVACLEPGCIDGKVPTNGSVQ